MLVKCFVINKSFRCDAPEGSDCYATIAYIACPFKIKIGDRQVGTRWSVDPVKVLGGWLTLLQLSPAYLLTVSHGWAGRPTARAFRRLWRLNRWGLLNGRIDVKWTSMNCLSHRKNCSVAASCGCRCVSLCISLQINALLAARPIAHFLSCWAQKAGNSMLRVQSSSVKSHRNTQQNRSHFFNLSRLRILEPTSHFCCQSAGTGASAI